MRAHDYHGPRRLSFKATLIVWQVTVTVASVSSHTAGCYFSDHGCSSVIYCQFDEGYRCIDHSNNAYIQALAPTIGIILL